MHTYDLGSSAFCGFDNYKQLFDTGEVGFFKAFFTFERAYGSGFVTSIKNSLILAFFSVFVQLPISLGLALLLGKKMKGEKALLTINFIPVLISTVIIAQMFQAIYYPGSGLLDAICDRVFHHPEWRQKLIKPELADELYDKVLAVMIAGKKYRDQNYSAQKLAGELGTNPRYLSAVINSRYGENYACLVNEFRIRDAQHMLTDKRYQNMTMEEIGAAVGFSNRQSFYAAFYKYKGVAPHKFRNMHS